MKKPFKIPGAESFKSKMSEERIKKIHKVFRTFEDENIAAADLRDEIIDFLRNKITTEGSFRNFLSKKEKIKAKDIDRIVNVLRDTLGFSEE